MTGAPNSRLDVFDLFVHPISFEQVQQAAYKALLLLRLVEAKHPEM